MTQRKIEYWVIPPQADAEFVAHMEQVLDLYQKPYDPNCPVVCMDEQPVQLVQETRPPMAATKNRPRRVDYEYERAGTAAVFLFSEPLAGWRQATARARRTKVDWALEVAGLLEGRYADCPKITLVCDHLNTHTKGAFYEVFEPARARELTTTASRPPNEPGVAGVGHLAQVDLELGQHAGRGVPRVEQVVDPGEQLDAGIEAVTPCGG